MVTLTQLRCLTAGPETLAGTSGVILPAAAVAFAAFAFAFQKTSILPALTRIEGTLPDATTSTVTFLAARSSPR